ncbi:MAG: polymer-forming cytoskeletal protein [Oscillospiraceae bacterium]|jgi:cytoskeletal protein CcmA (bactofilin family)|nr:polymer-forming cytoskeletal protein [Oscillospiraceae bacterium]
MGIKENFTQAVKELTGAGKEDKKSSQVEDLKRALEAESAVSEPVIPLAEPVSVELPAEMVVPEAVISPAVNGFNGDDNGETPMFAPKATHSGLDVNIQDLHQTPNVNELMFSSSYSNGSEPSPVGSPFASNGFPRAEPSPVAVSPYTSSAMAEAMGEVPDAPEELTLISKSTVIEGNLRSFGNINVEGNIRGDIETTKNIDLNGKIIGNLTCNNAQMLTSQIQGNIRMKGNILMGRDTLLIGDLVSTYAKVNGKVKGNLEIGGKAELKSDAVIFGDISASTITVDDGAIIQGYVSTTFLNKEESRNIFPDAISIAE